ncbi:Nramp family divalent metal transporter [Thermoflexus hugenholtzii]
MGDFLEASRGIRPGDRRTVELALRVLMGREAPHGLARVWPFLGPAFVASVAYMDPGNFATNIQGGARFGYLLLWVILLSNGMAMFLQALSAKLGIATGRNLAELCREHFPPALSFLLWILMELVAMATDLAEFVGAAVGFHLLLRLPLWAGALLTALAAFAILDLERHGFRPLEGVITALIGVVSFGYLVEILIARPDGQGILNAFMPPRFAGPESVLLAVGILGATVMPHALFLHSALTQDRIVVRDPALRRRLFRFEQIDVLLAMGIAGLINAAMLMMAAATFHAHGLSEIGTLEEAYRTLRPLFGPVASGAFALALLASGLSSSTVGTMSGQIIMQGFLRRRIPVGVRRLVTMLPSLVVIGLGLDPTRTLVISQVVLSFGLPFAVFPLIVFTARRDLMGDLANRPLTTLLALGMGTLIVGLNGYLLYALIWG